MKRKSILIDIDGTLSNCSHREPYLKLEKPLNRKFFDVNEMEKDTLNEWCKNIIDQFKSNYAIILLTGRQEKARKITENWLKKYDISYDLLIMKRDDDFRKGNIYKEDVYNNVLSKEFEILFAIDDNDDVVKLWRSLGITCLQCASNDF